MRIGISYHAGTEEYDAYEQALIDASRSAGVAVDSTWLAGANRPFLVHALLGLDAMVFTGGDDVGSAPERDAVERALMEHALRKNLPVLAICRGAQLLNVVCGGTLIEDLDSASVRHKAPREARHSIDIAPGSLLANVAGALGGAVNSSHHQAVDTLATGFRVSATAPDGVVEAFEREDAGVGPFLLAVQWHPELMPRGADLGGAIFGALLQNASKPT